MTRDPQFGPVIMFGLGGIFVELFKDVSFRIAPLERKDAKEMIREIKAYPLLEGFRGTEPADLNSLINLILKVSDFSMEFEDVKEIDLNPVFIYKDGLITVDARIILT
jgi:acetyl-CoA synthetase (ADP-forming)